MQLKTPSKVNLYLRIVDKLENGYHEIETVFVPLNDICDVISITEIDNSEITISSKNQNVPLDSSNLCYKAAERYASKANIEISFNIDIEKNIPIAAGMGGGSSDAAAVLLLLNRKYNKLTETELSNIALELGADVPYFLNPVPALGRGVGEELTEIKVADGLYVVIVAPQYPVSAAWAYQNFSKPENQSFSDINELLLDLEEGNWEKVASNIYNDLSFALYEKFPLENILKSEMLEEGAINVEITGSGPTLYGICKDREDAKRITDCLNEKYSDTFFCAYSKVATNLNRK